MRSRDNIVFDPLKKRRHVIAEGHELATLMWAFVYFYCLLCSYYIIRPIRDAMGISTGIESLQSLYVVTIIVMLALVPFFGWLTSRWPRRKFLPFIYLFFITNFLIFAWLACVCTGFNRITILFLKFGLIFISVIFFFLSLGQIGINLF